MTTKTPKSGERLTYHYITDIDYAGLEYDPDEPEPLPDAMEQDPILRDFMHVLADHCTESDRSPDNFLSSNTILCYDRNNLNVRVQPDCYLAFGVDVRAIRRRKMYLPWEVGKPPDFALEVGSESTSENDIVRKRRKETANLCPNRHPGILAVRPHWRRLVRAALVRRTAC